jgi:hypothetical protein
MTRSDTTRLCGSLIMRTLLFALFVVCGASNPTRAQEIVKGTFTLSEGTRFGDTLLPAGHYTVSIEPITSLRAVGSLVSVFVRPDGRTGPVASVVAMASQQGCEVTPNGLKLLSDGTGLVARSMCLETQGLMVHFDLSRTTERANAALAPAQP